MKSGYLIRGGEVYDGTGSTPVRGDVRIRGSDIAEIGTGLAARGEEIVDARGLIVTPGLLDLHVHVFSGMGIFAIDPEEAGVRSGVTTLVDAGTAGALTYPTFHRFVAPQAREEIFAFLHISLFGVQGHPEKMPFMGDLKDPDYAHVPSAVACIRNYPDRIVGVKVRLTSGLAKGCADGERAGFRAALQAAVGAFGLPLARRLGLPEGYVPLYLGLWYAAGLGVAGTLFLAKGGRRFSFRELAISAGMASCSVLGWIGIGAAGQAGLPDHIVLPVAIGGGLFVVAGAGLVLFKERITRWGLLGIFLGTAGVSRHRSRMEVPASSRSEMKAYFTPGPQAGRSASLQTRSPSARKTFGPQARRFRTFPMAPRSWSRRAAASPRRRPSRAPRGH